MQILIGHRNLLEFNPLLLILPTHYLDSKCLTFEGSVYFTSTSTDKNILHLQVLYWYLTESLL
jgi:hypothetical protein